MENLAVFRNCINCSLKFTQTSEKFTEMILKDQDIRSKDVHTKVIDAILCIYGLTANELAQAHLDKDYEDARENTSLNNITEHINKNGVPLCFQCLTCFQKVYLHFMEFQNLSSEGSLLTKAISKYFPSKIKIEVESETFDNDEETCGDEEQVSKNMTNSGFPVVVIQKLPVGSSLSESHADSLEDLQNDFNFEQDSDEESCEDIKVSVDPLNVVQSAVGFHSDTESELKFSIENGNNVPRTGRCRPRKINPLENKSYSKIYSETPITDKSCSHSRATKTLKSKSPKTGNKYPKCDSEGFDKAELQIKLKEMRVTRKMSSIASILFPENNEEKETNSKSKVTKKRKNMDHTAVVPKPKRVYTEEEKAKLRKHLRKIRKPKSMFRQKKKKSKSKVKSSAVKTDPEGENMDISVPVELNDNINVVPPVEKTETEDQGEYSDSSEDAVLSNKCPHCGWECSSSSGLRQHVDRHVEKRKEQNQARLHVKQELANQKKLECSCGLYFRTLKGMQKHERHHESKDPVMCEICGETFPKQYRLHAHKSLQHGERPNLLPACDVCGKHFLWLEMLREHHQQNHSGVKAFICDVCGKSFGNRVYLRRHLIIHKAEKSEEVYKCEKCDLVLKHKDSLQKHTKRMHSENLKTYTCELCGKITKSTTNMRIHMKVHDPNRSLKKNSQGDSLPYTD